MPSPSDYLRVKVTVPAAGMSSADWDGVDPDIRERAYWTAREGCYARVQGFRDRCQGIVDGNLSEADALREVRAMLRATGYQPEPGTEGTIQDLSTDARQRLILDTNVAMVRERAYRDSMLGSLAYPAQRLVRIRYSRQPRDWDARWREAAAAVNYEGVATDGSHIALLTSPIWRKLSRFDLPYPPFDFNSGMGVDPVDYEEAQRHGLTIPEATIEGMDGESLNASLEASIGKMDGDLQQAFTRALADCVEVEGDRVYYTDPNGTRPVHWSEAGKVICGQRPPVIPDTQARTMVKFVEDQRQFDRAQRGVQGYATQEEWQALYDAVTRIQPTDVKESGTLYRGMSIPPNDVDRFLSRIRRDGYQALPTKMVDSWSRAEETAQRFAGGGKPGNERIILVNEDYRSGHRIDAVVRALQEQRRLVNKTDKHPHTNESEVLFLQAARHQVNKIVRGRDGTPTYVYVSEQQ